MTSFAFSAQQPTAEQVEAIAVFATRERDEDRPRAVPTADAAAVGAALGLDLAAELAAIGFDADAGAVARVPTRGQAAASVLLVVGLGDVSGDWPDPVETLRRAAGAAARGAAKDSSLAVVVPAAAPGGGDAATAQVAQAVTEGAGLGAYAFTRFRSKPTDLPSLERVVLLAGEGAEPRAVQEGLRLGETFVAAQCLARDLVNTPPGEKRPPVLAERIAEIAADSGLEATVLDEEALAEGGYGGILGVGRGSSAPPRLVELTYAPAGADDHVVLVGKGITFDSGGLSLKPTNAMTTMKSDMSGVAAVVATMSALAALDIRIRVTGLCALAENMPSGDATRVSDVLVHRGGKTVEVMNTDAEGRLVLADALARGVELQPDAMIDLATLTGAQIVALGNKISALMGTDDALIAALQDAARATGERLWHLPLPPDYAETLRSEVADLRNVGKGRDAGTLVAGLFLKEFTGDVPWAHLDIAGPAFTEDGDKYYTPKGGTGVMVRTLLQFLRQRSAARTRADAA